MTPIRYAMVGGGRDAFIGAVHRHAMALDSQYTLTAGALSSTPHKAIESGRALGLPEERIHADWQSLLRDELQRPAHERVELVAIVTPNHLHYEIARAFVAAGFHVVCDKPLVHTVEEAEDLAALVAKQKTLFAVTYNYTGYPMVREARELVLNGVIGPIRKVIVEYHQGWLAGALEAVDSKQSAWRKDPALSGPAGALGDIGTHAESLMTTVTGLEIDEIFADLTSFGANRSLDDDASLLIRFKGGAKGVLLASQIATGYENDLRLRVIGEAGSLDWRQEEPNVLTVLPLVGPRRVITRMSPQVSEASRRGSRLPSGHPEGFIEAFANLYQEIAAGVRARANKACDDGCYPKVSDGVRGVQFVHATMRSAQQGGAWVRLASHGHVSTHHA